MRLKLFSSLKGYLSPLFSSEKLLNSLANIGRDDVVENFDTTGANLGKPWKDITDATKQKRRKGRARKSPKPLQDSGVLYTSVSKLVRRKESFVTTNRNANGWNIAELQNEDREFMKFSDFAVNNMLNTIKKDSTNV